jgi:hypothetical protein
MSTIYSLISAIADSINSCQLHLCGHIDSYHRYSIFSRKLRLLTRLLSCLHSVVCGTYILHAIYKRLRLWPEHTGAHIPAATIGNPRFAATGFTFSLDATGALYFVATSETIGYFYFSTVQGTVYTPVTARPGGLPLMLQLGYGPNCPTYASAKRQQW